VRLNRRKLIEGKSNNYGPLVVVAVQQTGRGRAMAFASDTTQSWGSRFHTILEQDRPFRVWGWAADAEAEDWTAGMRKRKAK
jgi:hypothetical protein